MGARPIIDAGPALNFFAINKERVLFDVVGPLSTTETVRNEILSKARSKKDVRFAAAEKVLNRLMPKWVEVLSDDGTPELDSAVHRISQLPLAERKTVAADLGETMVVAHAAVKAEAGEHVVVIIDDQGGAALAIAEKSRLDRLRTQNPAVGSIVRVSTLTILAQAAGRQYIPDRRVMRDVYGRLCTKDDGLPPIEKTRLLAPDLWK